MTATSREKLYQCVIVSGCGLDYSLLLLLLMLFVHRGVVSRVLPAVVSFSVGSRFYCTVLLLHCSITYSMSYETSHTDMSQVQEDSNVEEDSCRCCITL